MILQYIPPIQLNSIWPKIKPGIEEILVQLNKDYSINSIIPEDVYHSIKKEEALLYTCPAGWVVVRVDEDKYSGVKKLFIWMVYSPKGAGLFFREEVQKDLEDMAKYFKCSAIEWQTTRKGWEKLSPTLGYEVGITTYYKRVQL